MIRRDLVVGGTAICLAWVASAVAQERTAWTTHDELKEWIGVPTVVDAPSSTEDLIEEGRAFVRIRWGGRPYRTIVHPSTGISGIEDLATAPPIFDPTQFNAVALVVRNTTGMDSLTGRYMQETSRFDETLAGIPDFPRYPLPSDGTWREVVARLPDSPLFDPESGVVYIGFLLLRASDTSMQEVAERYEGLPDSGYLDVDRIELRQVEVQYPVPVITGFTPVSARVTESSTLVVAGSGFATPPSRNAVFMGETEVAVLGGSDSELRIRPVPGRSIIRVLTPGGGVAQSASAFGGFVEPTHLVAVSGDGQRGRPGESLQPLVVRLFEDAGPDSGEIESTAEIVDFRLTSGDATLSAAQERTDQEGRAAVVVTLGETPGPVTVVASYAGLAPVSFMLEVEEP